jgi:hypothetical protein
MSTRLPIPKELMLEKYEKRKYSTTIDNLGLTVELIPGADGKGAIVKGFISAIDLHDDITKKVDNQVLLLKNVRRDFTKKNRMYRNLDGSWNVLMSDHQTDFEEYQVLLPKMDNIEERLELITDEKAKLKLEADYERFKFLKPTCEKIAEVLQALEKAREERDTVQQAMTEADVALARYRSDERKIAENITDDHIIACEQGKQISEIFPNIQPNNVLYSLNKTYTESLDFEKIKILIKKEPPPHNVIFCRYDYRYDPFLDCWHTLGDLRDMGVCIDDPMLTKAEFVALAATGNFTLVKDSLLRGEDPNCSDYTGATGMHAAASNKHQDVVELLIRAGAQIDSRDKNQLTPLLAAVMKGHLPAVRQLIESGADRNATEKNGRNALYFAMTCGSLNMVKFFVNTGNVNDAEQLWGFTPLHTAANLGNVDLATLLVTYGGSIYKKDMQGRTSEEVAREARYNDVAEFLELERFSAPAQCAYVNKDINIRVWVGEFGALDPKWSTDVGITEVICLPSLLHKPTNIEWLKDDDECKHVVQLVDVDDEDTTDASFIEFKTTISGTLTHLLSLLKKGDAEILICDPRGKSTAAALLSIALLFKFQIPITTSLAATCVARPAVQMSKSLRRGLEKIQMDFNDQRMKRLDAKIRHAVVLSNGF